MLRGITFDTGFANGITNTREPFVTEIVRREMQIIREDLHCDAVRITGAYPDRLEIAGAHAASAGLEVWLSPFTNGLTIDKLLDVLADCAERAERLRRNGAGVIFLTGSEVSLFAPGVFPGETLEERLALIADPLRVREVIPRVRAVMKDFFIRAVQLTRARFGGKVSYASLPHEGVDWTLFDIVATDAGYRSKQNALHFRENIRAFVAHGRTLGRPVAITEFGCMTFRGAADEVRRDDSVVEWGSDGRPARLIGDFVRDENEQANYLGELLDIFDSEGVDAVFVNTLARYDLPHHTNPREDFDVASYGIVKVFDRPTGSGLPWEPKAAFKTLANRYA